MPPVEEPKVNIQQIIEACVKQIQAQQPREGTKRATKRVQKEI